jgi:glycosyltransferase involved in cell wall biosynthesis
MQRVVAQLPNAQLAIAGDGHQRAQVEALIDELRLTQNVQLLGRISDTALRDWYRMADLVVTPTQELEGFGLSTAEAMACGTPCLVTPVGANAELTSVLDERLVAAGKSSADLAERMVELTRNLEELHALGARAREVVEQRWSWGAVVDAHLAMYEEFNHGVS